MHHYLKAVGLGMTDPVEMPEILREEIFYKSDDKARVPYGEYYFVQREKSLSSNPAYDFGLFSCGFSRGSRSSAGQIRPYLKGRKVSIYADILMERDVDGETYKAVFEYDNRNSGLLFEVINAPEILNADREGAVTGRTGVILSGLSNGGEILLPIYESAEMKEKAVTAQENRKKLIQAAREGDSKAASQFAMADMALYNRARQLLGKTDLYSVVASTLTPKGIINAEYNVLGEIMEYTKTRNIVTGEEIFILTLQVNELLFDVAVPATGIMGEVAKGRRFKGELHLQGCISLPEEK